jgi:type I restriction-modification system methyltransferase subunit like protein
MTKTIKKGKEVSLESVLWDCRVALRGVGTTEKNRDAVISLVFLKFAGDKFEKRKEEIQTEHGDIPMFCEKPAFYNAKNVFYLKDTARWSYIVENAGANDIAIILDQAIADIEDMNPSLKGALSLNLFANLGADKSKIKNLINNINKIDEAIFHEKDLIGRVYEYFLRLYAASGTKEDGEFYTPSCVVKLISELIEPYSGIVYDPCCGSGGMFVQSVKFIEAHHGNKKDISIIGQESQAETWRLCKMNLAIRGISHNLGEKNASTFTEDLHKDKKVDFIMANPPFNLKNWRNEDELTNDARWRGYALPRVSNANYAWILHMISKLDVSHGIAGFLLSNGALNEQDDFEIRKKLVENDKVEAIIVLPRNMFYTTDISVTLWILNMNKNAVELNGRKLRNRTHEVLFMDLRTWDDNIDEIAIDKKKTKKKVILNEAQIKKIKGIYSNWQSEENSKYKDIPELCKSVTLEEIKTNSFSLAPSKYIEFIDRDLEIDYDTEMSRIQNELKNIMKDEKESQQMLVDAFRGIGYEID